MARRRPARLGLSPDFGPRYCLEVVHWDINVVFRGLAEQSQAAVNAARAIEMSGASGEQRRLTWRRRQAALESYREIVGELVRA